MFAWWWRDAGTLAERQREGPLSQQRGRRRDDTAAGGWRGYLAGSRGERTRDSGGSRARVLTWFSRRGGSGGGAKWRRSSREMVAGIAEAARARNGGEKWRREMEELRARGRKGLQL
ncbi:hypothetical protein DEO72_LG3g1671 [Vigna unguiculata]|uniref:Uncharacterized protein n=1 Tax=Vigna unguiculata TaxID=3917 RepID=A0A4D6LF60_VIGUN|nr:hypothetical protein DEO72_LG3g1671 [Vigna unguiculata]